MSWSRSELIETLRLSAQIGWAPAGWRRPAQAAVRRPGEQDIRISASIVRPRHENGAGGLADGHPREAVEAVCAPREWLRDRDDRRDSLLHVERLAAVEGPGEQDLVFVEILPSDVHLPSGADGDRRALVLRVRGMAERKDRGPGQAPVRGPLEHDLRAVAPLEEGPRDVHVPVTGAARVVDRDPLFVGNARVPWTAEFVARGVVAGENNRCEVVRCPEVRVPSEDEPTREFCRRRSE